VHPIEHLRYVARARGADPVALVRETAYALTSMRFDPAGLVVSCRRIVERHPDCAALWWLCARLLTSTDPHAEAMRLGDVIADDPTASELAHALPDDAVVVTVGDPVTVSAGLARRGDVRVLAVESRHEASAFVRRLERADVAYEPVQAEAIARAVGAADVVLLEAVAVSPERVVAPVGSAAAAAVAWSLDVPVWLVAGVGRRLPDPYASVIADRLSAGDEPWELDHDVFATGLVTHVLGADGLVDLAGEPARLTVDCPLAPELLRISPI
jgi:hypothetical protein